MKINEKDIGLIEEYLDGNLSGEELKSFNDRLENDADFAEFVEVRKEMASLMKEAGEYEDLKSQIGNMMEENTQTFFQAYKHYILPIAASIVILIGIYLVFQFQTDGGGDNIHVAETTDSVSVLNIDEPPRLAKIKTVNSVEILAPVNKEVIETNESIVFTWKTDSDQFGTLYVINENDNSIMRETEVNLSKGKYEILNNQFPQGEYKWYLNDTINSGSFIVQK